MKWDDYCSDLVTLKRNEPLLLKLLRDHPVGQWVPLSVLHQDVGFSARSVKPELVSVWLPDPYGHEGFVVIVFFDTETYWSFAAHYNRQRILNADDPSAL